MPPKGRGRKAAIVEPDFIDPDEEAAAAEDELPILQADILLKQLAKINVANFVMPPKPNNAYKDDGKRRMIIRHMELRNFKSYYGKRYIGEFHPHFSCIVGANGSGKSNIIDALLFVFGFKASKIRSSKIESLIHKSSRFPNEKECSVRVVFTEVQETTNGHNYIENTDFSVIRSIKVNERGVATSTYYFNQHPVSMAELKKALSDHGIDLEYNRFLILQGEVELISTLKPKALHPKDQGLLEYLEDVIGTNRYQEKVTQIEQLLKNVNQTAQAQAERVSKALTRKMENIVPVRDMLNLLMLQNRIAHANWRIYSIDFYDFSAATEKYKAELVEVKELLAQKTARYDEVVHTNKVAKESVNKIETELNESKLKHRNIKSRYENMQLQLKKDSTAVDNAQKRVSAREKAHKTDLDRIAKLNGVPEKKLAESEALRNELAEVNERRDALRLQVDEKNAAARNETTFLEGERSEVGRRLADLKRKDGQLKAQIELAETNLKGQSEPLEEAKRRYDEGRSDLETKEQEHETRKNTLDETCNRTVEFEDEIKTLQIKSVELQKREKSAAKIFDKCRVAYSSAERERSDYDKSVQSTSVFMSEKRSGRIPGICGRLGDLGHIDAKYDVTVSTNCRSSLEIIIVEDAFTVQQCLKFVEDNRLPRTRFMPLEKMQHLDWSRSVPNSHGLARLFDFIEPTEPQYLAAFYYFLRDMLVCDDISMARDVARSSGQNVVTVDGNIVSATGTLTGGGSNARIARGAMGIKSMDSRPVRKNAPSLTEAEIEELRRKKNESERVLLDIRAELDGVKAQLNNLERQFKMESTMKRRLEEEVHAGQKNMIFLRKNLDELRQQFEIAQNASEDTSRTADLEAQIKQLGKERNALKSNIGKVQAEHDAVSKRIKNIYNEIAGDEQDAFETAEARRKELDKKILDLRKSSKKAETELDQCRANVDLAKAAIAELQSDVERLAEKRDKLKHDVDDLAEAVQLESENVEKLQKALTTETAQAEADDIEEVTLNRDIAVLKDRRNKVAAKFAQKNDKVEDVKNKLDHLKLHAIQDLQDEANHHEKKNDKSIDFYDDIDDMADFDENDFGDNDCDFVENVVAPTVEPEPTEYDENGSNDHKHLSFKSLTPDQCKAIDRKLWEVKLLEYEAQRVQIKTPLNMRILEDFRQRINEHKEEERLLKEIRGKAKIFNEAGNTLLVQRTNEFNEAVKIICANFKKQYYDLSLGGESDILVPNGGDPYTEGIQMVVRPQNKGWREITQISGGEKTIASLSLVFALHQYQPTPFYVMDEIDAALDFRNVSMISRLVKEKTKNSQFIIISLRNNMQQAANRIIGVNKVRDCARALAFEYTPSETQEERLKRWNAEGVFE